MILSPPFLATADAGRVARALTLSVMLAGKPGQYRVTGGSAPHYVDIRHGDIPGCDCEDFIAGGNESRPCKHILAAHLVEIGKHPRYVGVCSECGTTIANDEESHRAAGPVARLYCGTCAAVCTAGVR